MKSEQEKAIYRLKMSINIPLNDGSTTIVNVEDIETALNMLKEKDKQIAKYEKIYKEYDCYRWVKELEKKDKQIDLMTEFIEKVTVDLKVAFGENMLWNRDEIKQYFERKASK